METQQIFDKIDTLKPQIIKGLTQLIAIPAIGPESNGDGEQKKAEILTNILTEAGFDKVERYDAKDPRVPSGKRPNIIATLKGATDKQKLWIITHLDVVPAGDEALWKVTKPFEPTVLANRVYGRGSEDNGQSIMASLFAAKALRQLGITPKRTIKLAFVADEEAGSTKGIQHLLNQNLFNKDDLVIVPDSGNPKGNLIEIAEKSILWFKLTTFGKQTHGSLPHKGLNAHRTGMQVALALDNFLHKKYVACDKTFDVPFSTFEPTRKDKNVDAVNIVPGEDAVYFDCRILPRYDLEEVLEDINKITEEYQKKTGAKIQIDILQKQTATPIPEGKSETVSLLKQALIKARSIEAKVGGVGGGTCAAFFREAGIPAVVWSTVDEVAHQPDEYCLVGNLVADAKVFALLAVL